MTAVTKPHLSLLFAAALCAAAAASADAPKATRKAPPKVPAESKPCVDCHREQTPATVAQWGDSKHARLGIACLDCHKADDADVDGFLHQGTRIATIVTPKDCARCHESEADEFTQSHHAKAAKFVGSLDNILGEIVEGRFAAANGCLQCHGSTVALQKGPDGEPLKDAAGKPQLDPMTWPNTGIGRVNLDGSLGSCTACHMRHGFSRSQARQPEICGKCHMGPDHPQIEIYNESKHGVMYRARRDEMNLESDSWIAGKDYDAAPTCATCHMSATATQEVTHDVGDRISWTLRPVVSTKLENWEPRRKKMQDVCLACHAQPFIAAFYEQFDATVELYNGKFAKPAQRIMDALRTKGKLTPTPFDEKLEWSFYKLWHHEGRRARMGVSMQGPDYTQWHGFFEVAERFYFDFLPEAKALASGDADIEKVIAEVGDMPEHSWKKGMKKEDIEAVEQFYKERYGAK